MAVDEESLIICPNTTALQLLHSPAACCLCICIWIIWNRELAAAAAAVALAKLAAAATAMSSAEDFNLVSRNLRVVKIKWS